MMIQKTIFFLLLILSMNCQNSNRSTSNAPNKNLEQNPLPAKTTTPIPEGEHYNATQIDDLVKNALKKELKIDSTKTLQQIDCGELFNLNNYQIAIDYIDEYQQSLYEINDALKKVLNVSSCFRKIKETAHYQAYIFLTNPDAHYSKQAKLISISKKDQTIKQIALSYNYRNELGESLLSTIFKTNDSFIRTLKIKQTYIHGIGAVDSLEIKTEAYTINGFGDFIKSN